MKKVVALLATVVASAALVVGGASANEATPLYEDSGFGCGVIDRGGGFLFTTDSYLVWRQSGDVYLRCEAQGTPGATIEKTTGFLCGLGPFGLTTLSKNVVRRGGEVQLECRGHVNPGDNVDTASSGGYGAS